MAFIIGSPLLLVNLHFLDRRSSFGFKSQCLCVQVSSQVQIPSSNYLPFSCFLYSTDCKVTDFSILNANKSFLFKLILRLLIKFGKSGEWKVMINTIFSLCLRRQREFVVSSCDGIRFKMCSFVGKKYVEELVLVY